MAAGGLAPLVEAMSVPSWCDGLHSGVYGFRAASDAATKLTLMVTSHVELRPAIMAAGAIPAIVGQLTLQGPWPPKWPERADVSYVAAYALCVLADDESGARACIDAGAVPPLFAVFRSEGEASASAVVAALALAHIALSAQDRSIAEEAAKDFARIIAIIGQGDDSIKKGPFTLLRVIFGLVPECRGAAVAAGVLPALISGLGDDNGVLDVILSLVRLCEASPHLADSALEAGVLEPLLACLSHRREDARPRALSALLGMLELASKENRRRALEVGAAHRVAAFFSSEESGAILVAVGGIKVRFTSLSFYFLGGKCPSDFWAEKSPSVSALPSTAGDMAGDGQERWWEKIQRGCERWGWGT